MKQDKLVDARLRRHLKHTTSRRAQTTSSAGEALGTTVPVTKTFVESLDSRAQDISPRATATPRGEPELWGARARPVGRGCASRGSRK